MFESFAHRGQWHFFRAGTTKTYTAGHGSVKMVVLPCARAAKLNCFDCPAGKVSAIDRVSCEAPRARKEEPKCPRGHFGGPKTLDTIDLECDKCPKGKYQPNQGASSCYACEHGKQANDAATACHEVRRIWRFRRSSVGPLSSASSQASVAPSHPSSPPP